MPKWILLTLSLTLEILAVAAKAAEMDLIDSLCFFLFLSEIKLDLIDSLSLSLPSSLSLPPYVSATLFNCEGLLLL